MVSIRKRLSEREEWCFTLLPLIGCGRYKVKTLHCYEDYGFYIQIGWLFWNIVFEFT